MISKLMAWAEDRPTAIARMRRGLAEYRIGGIKTTLPLFTWLLAQPEFLAGRFHTTYLDEVVVARAGRPFIEPPQELEDVAAISVALQAVLLAAPRDAGLGTGRWKAQARTEGLRSGAAGRREARPRG
jgi:acetyl-CoA carboxylase, biotin carboxylase subunit